MGDASKYEGEVDLSDRNNSRTLMIEMVGANKRVLEVGCASGYMSKVMTERGCRVIGIEIDPEAATIAKEYCEDVVVGDVETMDLQELFGERRFDAVLFGDVLEHLRDPLPLLRRARPLLDLGGFVVASMPNIAHGSVRLSLMRGHFEYRDLGLLDKTHLTFFTKESIEKLFREAGFVVVEMGRTTAGIFEVEIPLDRASYPVELLAEVESDPESNTYQFLPRAVPDDGLHAIAALHEREEAQRIAILELRRRITDFENRLGQAESGIESKIAEIAILRRELTKIAEENTSLRLKWEQLEARPLVRAYRRLQRIVGKQPPDRPAQA
jgi:2-polyprenyl-3-methyl-5-hydroxy-6-metoxy-1,4-benzoquinol methylase